MEVLRPIDCLECFALVNDKNYEVHKQWHDEQRRKIDAAWQAPTIGGFA